MRFFLRFNFLAAHAKEVTEQRRALIRQYSFRNFHSVIHTRMMQHIH
ncbi:hypothetical protein MyNCGM683_51880 [Achromobacter xylosoxidans]